MILVFKIRNNKLRSTLRRDITPEINAVGTVIVVLSLGLIGLSIYLLRQSAKE